VWRGRDLTGDGPARELHQGEAARESAMLHVISLLGPLFIVLGVVGSIRDLTGRSDRRF
jgi:hypothetical protein